MLKKRLRRLPNIEPTLAECKMFEEKLSHQYSLAETNYFAIPAVIKSVSLQTQRLTESQS